MWTMFQRNVQIEGEPLSFQDKKGRESVCHLSPRIYSSNDVVSTDCMLRCAQFDVT
jgi:hypothetical protein